MKDPFTDVTGVFRNRDVLQEDYQPDEILERDEEIETYSNKLIPVLNGERPDHIFVYGKTGVGKTVVTKSLMDLLMEKVDDLTVLHVNCNDHPSSYQVASGLLNELRKRGSGKLVNGGYATNKLMEMLYSEIDTVSGTVLIVLDEIDNIEDDDILYALPRARANENVEDAEIGVIGISNDYTFREHLSPKVKDTLMEQEVRFPPYDAGELRNILSHRAEFAFEDDVVEDGVIELCSALAARDRGSARQGLDLLREAGTLVREQGRDTVTVDDVHAAKERVVRGRISDSIGDLTTHGKLVLLAVALNAESGPSRSKDLYQIYERLAHSNGVSPLTLRSIQDHLADLSMLGFVNQREHNQGRAGGKYFVYDLDVERETVIDTLQEIGIYE